MSDQNTAAREQVTTRRPRVRGVGRVLVFVYGILAIAATGRSVFQILDRFNDAPIAFTLSAVSALIYIVATIALVAPGRIWYRVAWITISFELAGVLIVGSLSVFAPQVAHQGAGMLPLTVIDDEDRERRDTRRGFPPRGRQADRR